ncbi:tudor domain-containing protein 3-like [Lytechinus variegatus]|uniref:tudor domain-containing protein 3-like n=1 Tax=Lytechinus variegatus TaxID=7654 RepID=UPI001BB212AA|nr:tudor domain-containing protein 3-like [Lytechinus variegatus]
MFRSLNTLYDFSKMVEAELLTRGWHLSKDGIERCKDGVPAMSVDALTKRALDIDLKQIGSNALPADIGKAKSDKIQGPYVLQIQKVRNIGAPKANEESSMAPTLLRLQLTDGHTTCLGVVMETISQISLNTPPGTKVLLKGSVDMTNGLLMLSPSTLKVLGGRVEDMVERWEVAKQLAHHTRTTLVGEGAPPPWVPFGQRHRVQNHSDSRQKIDGPGKKRTLNLDKNREQTDQDREFEEQRKAAIKELDQARGQGGKKFGGGGTKAGGQDNDTKENQGGTRSSYSDRRGTGSSGGALSENNRNSQSFANYRELGYEKKPDDKSISQLVSMGFSKEDAVAALKKHSGNLDAAVDSLVGGGSNQTSGGSGGITNTSNTRSSSGPPQRGRDRPERGSGGFKGRRGRRGDDDEDEDAPSQPSAPTTLFDFLESKLGPTKAEAYKPKEKNSRDHGEKNDRSGRYEREQSKTGRDASGNNFTHNVRETPPRFQKLQAQKQAQRQMGDNQPGNKDNRGGRRGDRQDRYDDRRRDGKKNNEWTNDKEDASQGYKNDSRFRNERKDGGYQDRNDRRFDGQSRGSKADEYQNDKGYQGRDRNSRPERFQSDRGRSSQKDGYQNDNGYQGRGNRRYDGQGKSGDSSRYNSSKNDNTPEKTYRLMERKKDNVPAQEESQSTKKSNGKETSQQDGVGNWKGLGQEENAVKNQVNSRSDFQPLNQQSQPFIPQQQMVSDAGRRVADTTNQGLNQGPVVRTKVMTNGPEMIPQGQGMPMLPFKEGDHCLSKYWEDGKFYEAQITAIHPSGKTCMVKFVEYGNFEEVLITDIMPSPDQPWTAPPPPIAAVHHQQQQQPPQQQQFMTPAPPYPQHYQQPPPMAQLVPGQTPLVPDYGNYDGSMNMTLEFRKGGDGPFVSKQGQDPGGYRNDRRNQRPAQAFYQPPPRR